MGKHVAGVSRLPQPVAGKAGLQMGTVGEQAGISPTPWLMDTVCHQTAQWLSPRVHLDQGDEFQRSKVSGAAAQEQVAFQ